MNYTRAQIGTSCEAPPTSSAVACAQVKGKRAECPQAKYLQPVTVMPEAGGGVVVLPAYPRDDRGKWGLPARTVE